MDNLFKWFCGISFFIMLLIILNSIIGDLKFRLQYSFPKVTEITQKTISTYNDPIQTSVKETKYIKTQGEKNKFALKAEAEYSISAIVLTTNSNFWFRDIMRSKFDDICLLDLGLAWGELADDPDKLYKHWKFKSIKTLGQSRRLEWRAKPPYDDIGWNLDYVSSHVAHTHIIPANANVMGALLKIKKNDIVKLDGYLVDIYTDKSELIAKTSLSRTDRDATSRGSGACEDMYVTQVQIGNKIYR